MVPHGHWQTTTLLMGLRAFGPVATLVVDRAINGDRFRACIDQHLRRDVHSGDTVVLDNTSAHKVVGVAAAIQSVGNAVRHSRSLRTLPSYPTAFSAESISSIGGEELASVPTVA